ncbi:substrate-binding domain-containing protein [Fodinicurvata sp. EGI_FJ10296]|uniref:sugar ABC transporter substrate-binding protein n=1 Tax=Fodinicurvata sp. EGI_FJ10296 TaxID=3231908 RepID=UPI0034563956
MSTRSLTPPTARPATIAAASLIAAATAGIAPSSGAADDQAQQRVAVLTPFLSSVATNEMVETFQTRAEDRGWAVNVIDTRGSMADLANRLADTAGTGVDAVVLVSIDPAEIGDQVQDVADAGIPVVLIDGGSADGVMLNVTSDNFALGSALSQYLIDEIGGSGNLVKFFHSAHPGVRQRELALDDALAANPDVQVIADHYVQVPGPIDDSRVAMENIIRANRGEIDAVWAAWDEPAIGAWLAAESEGEAGSFIIAGIDGNPQAVEMIESCTAIVATVAQDFAAMADIASEELASIFAGDGVSAAERYAPANVITRESLGVSCD